MARPTKHPKTGMYQFRRAVPLDLQPILGRREVKRSLETRDPDLARKRFAAVLAEVDAKWARLRRSPEQPQLRRTTPESDQRYHLTDAEAHERARWLYSAWIDGTLPEARDPDFWQPDLLARLWTGVPLPSPGWTLAHASEVTAASRMEAWISEQVTGLEAAHGWDLDDAGRSRMARALAAAVQRAVFDLQKVTSGQLDPVAIQHRSRSEPPPAMPNAHLPAVGASLRTGDKQTLTGLLEGWWREARAAGRKPSTYESYRATIQSLVAYLGHDDASRATADSVIGFKDHRLTVPSARTGKVASAKTVKDSDLSALKTIFGWAVTNRRMMANPAADITLKVGKSPKLRSKGFTDEEARALLAAALAYKPGRETIATAAAKRWVPWLCAFTGARVGELAQLRKEDVRQVGDVWVIRITPEAGTVKTNEAREVVLHAQVVQLGFPAFVRDAPAGHLFLRPGDEGDVLGPLQGLKNRLAEAAREVVPDKNVAPNHGWRHRFKTVGMEAGIAPRILDAIQGQAPRSVADTYGDVTIKTVASAIRSLPSFSLPAIDTSSASRVASEDR